MAKSELIARQSAHPRGLFGRIVGRVMALDTAAANQCVLDAVDLKPGDRALDLGCGHGRTLGKVAARIEHGRAMGVDPSEVMCRLATRHNRKAIASGHVSVERASAADIPALDASFDKAFSVHTIYFWPDLEAGLRELRRVVRPGGELWLGFHSSEHAPVAERLPESVYTLRSGDEIARALENSGFDDVQITIEKTSQLRLAKATAKPLGH